MKRITVTMSLAALALLGPAAASLAGEPTEACNGLDTAHEQTHGSGSEAEDRHHELRDENHCDH